MVTVTEKHLPSLGLTTKYRRHVLTGRYIARLFDQLMDEYNLTKAAAAHASVEPSVRESAIEILDGIVEKSLEQGASLDDVLRFKACLLSITPDADLEPKASVLFHDYCALTGCSISSDFTSPCGADKSLLRSRLIQLTNDMNHHYLARAERWRQRVMLSSLNLTVFLVAAASLGVLASGYFFLSTVTALHCFLAGVIGGVISAQQRIIRADVSEEGWARAFSWSLPAANVVLSPIFGGIGAIVLFAFLKAEFTKGIFAENFLPRFSAVCPARGGPLLCFVCARPDQARDAALLFLLSITAGFSERLVPNLLDRLRRGEAQA
jgi:hypothetical protein